MKIGDTVKYKASFLRSIGMYTGDMPRAKGKVVGLVPLGQNTLAEIEWSNWDGPKRVLTPNLVKLDPKKGLPHAIDP